MSGYRTLSATRLVEMASRVPSIAVGIADFKVLSPQVAQVIVTPSETRCTREELAAAITRATEGKFTPVLGSFRSIPGARVPAMVGFVTSNKEVITSDEPRYKTLRPITASSMLDAADQSLWDVRQGEDGKPYVIRALDEDMTTLLASYSVRDIAAPSLREMASITQPENFVSYVDLSLGELKHGFVVATLEDGQLSVLATDAETAAVIPESCVVEVALLGDQTKEIAADVSIDDKNFDSKSPASMVEFYKALYGYAPGYVKSIEDQINSHATA